MRLSFSSSFHLIRIVGDAGDAIGRDEVLGVTLLEDPAGINEEDFALPGFWLGLVEEQDDTWGGGVVEEVFGQVEDALDEVLVNEPLADGFFPCWYRHCPSLGRRHRCRERRRRGRWH